MVREVLPRVHFCSLALIVSAFYRASSWTVLAIDCTRFDIAELEDYLSNVHPANLPAIDTMIGKFTSPVTELPFGALRSDWQRLLLLERAQPEGSILREKLGRLFRILKVAYIQTVEPFDITEQPVFSTTGSWGASTGESAVNFEVDQEGAEKLDAPAIDSTETNQISESSTSTTLLGLEEASRMPEVGITTSDTTVSYDKRFDYSTNPIESSSIIVTPSTFDENFENFENFNNSAFEKYDELANNKIDEDSQQTDRLTTQQQETNALNEDDLVENKIDLDYTTQEHQEINTFNATASAVDATVISTIAMSPSRSSTSRAIIEGDESWENSKVVASEESDPVNKHQGTKERVGYAKDGSSDHFRGAEVATVAAAAAAAAAVGGFVAGKSSVAGAVVEEDAQPITSPVSESDTPVTPFGSDFSTSRIRGYGTMNVSVAAAGIKESGTVVPTRTEIAQARGRGDSPLVYTPMNSEDQESTPEYSGSANTNDPGMTDVKTTIEQSRVRTDRIRGNEIPGDEDSLGRQPVRLKDGSPSTHRSSQNPVHYRDEITRPSVSRKPKVDSEFSNHIVIPRIVASTTGSASNRPDPPGDNRSRTGPVRSKKRGSLNTDLQKTFRWFYNAEKGESRHSDQRGIRIECSENGHDHGKSVS
ncbi:uncharacterized protein LOC143361361 [Halictus rubicundus]|uniref:uncharacterized protein LOC143361361 n=1 Tax=Halictus rubicundus TaxID=77578 RepID=UPI004035E2D8